MTPEVIERNPSWARRLHVATYVVTLLLMGTGWWLALGREGRPSPAARVLGVADVDLHNWSGWILAALTTLAVIFGWRGIASFVRETLRLDRDELGWFVRWPGALLTGSFGHHRGRFDPGQRIANVVMVGGLLVLTMSGIGLVLVPGGPAFVWLRRIHVWATYAVTPVILGHVVVASGVLPGYRGVWRAMHGAGLVRSAVAGKLWPAWTERTVTTEKSLDRDEGCSRRTG